MVWTNEAVIIITQGLDQFTRLFPFVCREFHAGRVGVEPVAGLNESRLDGLRIGAFKGIEQGGKKFLEKVGCLGSSVPGDLPRSASPRNYGVGLGFASQGLL
jgi:hypothetical protein